MGPLTVRPSPGGHAGMYWVENDYQNIPLEVPHEQAYVSFSGYYGAHGPHVFAAAPELLEALKAVVEDLKVCWRDASDNGARPEWLAETYGHITDAQLAIIKAKGGASC